MLKSKLELYGTNLRGTRFQKHAASLNVSSANLYSALVADAENVPPNFDLQGRQVDAWKEYRASRFLPVLHFSMFPFSLDYLPVDSHRTVVGHIHARVVSRALEVRTDSSCLSGTLNGSVTRNSMRSTILPSLR